MERVSEAHLLSCRKDGTKPHKAGKREIEIDREVPKITEVFMPNDLEDMKLQWKVQDGVAASAR